MAKNYQGFKFTYNLTTVEFSTLTENVTRTPEEASTIVTTPTGAKYKQVFGTKYRWSFTYSYLERDAFDFFDDAYEASVAGYSLTFSEEQDDGSYIDYTVIMNRPQATPHTLGTTNNYDRDLSVEIYEA
jgi:hypothetical protein